MATATKKTSSKTAGSTEAGASTGTSGGGSSRAAGFGLGSGMMGLPSMDDLTKMFERFKVPGIDISALVESQRKDLEALAEANRQAYEGIKALAQRRSELIQEALQQWQEAMKDATGKDALQKGADRAKRAVQKAIEDYRELAEMEADARKKAWKVLQDRFQENVANLQKMLRPK
jgi:phasin family protein